MQSPTHILTGIFLYKLIIALFPTLPTVWLVIITSILAFLSHGLIDAIAVMTYHPYKANWEDKFFKIYHIVFVYILTGVLVIYFLIPYWWVMIFALLPDIIDWYTLRPIWHHDPVIHPKIDLFRDKFFHWLPNLKEERWAVLVEFFLLIGLGIGITLL
ncbi:hypothetical protein [Candidatus Lokiarchaeum ossiferum]|uniref:hypothetical protein n=1 Tax=Candidatus Lokiarchaeum ossiferum TaxID=2951803 RepID=UPI00352F0102